MKICILGNAQSPHIKRWATFFRGRGHKVSIISARPDEMDGVEVYVPKLPFDSLLRRTKTFDEDRSPHLAIYLSYIAIALRIRPLMRRIAPDILMAMTMETNGIISMIAGHHPTALFHLGPKALSLRSETSLLMRWLVKRMIRYCDMLYTSDSAGVARLQELGAHRDRIYVNPWGVDLDPADSRAEAEELRARLYAQRRKLFVTIRVLLPEYDVATSLRAIPEILSVHPDTGYVIVGDGPERAKLEDLAADLGIRDHVTFVGFVPYRMLPAYLLAADYYVDPVNYPLPSGRTWWGHRVKCSMDGLGYSITLLLALACGCIPLVTRRAGLSDIFSEEAQRLLLWEAGNPADLGEKARHLLPQDTRLETLKGEFTALAAERFDWERNARRVEQDYLEKMAELAAGATVRTQPHLTTMI